MHTTATRHRRRRNTIAGTQCAPSRERGGVSCFTTPELHAIADAYNATTTTKPIDHHATTPRATLWRAIDDRMQNETTCATERCWVTSPAVRTSTSNVQSVGGGGTAHSPTANVPNLARTAFRPEMPASWRAKPTEWLSTTDIQVVMKQYEAAHKGFKFIGAVPVDFASPSDSGEMGRCVVQALCNVRVKRWWKQGIRQLGIVYNMDAHDEPGSHWTSSLVDLQRNALYYYDSFGAAPPPEVHTFFRTLSAQLEAFHGVVPTVEHNTVRHQFNNTECGIYSLFFLASMLEGTSFASFVANGLNDAQMNRHRRVFYSRLSDYERGGDGGSGGTMVAATSGRGASGLAGGGGGGSRKRQRVTKTSHKRHANRRTGGRAAVHLMRFAKRGKPLRGRRTPDERSQTFSRTEVTEATPLGFGVSNGGKIRFIRYVNVVNIGTGKTTGSLYGNVRASRAGYDHVISRAAQYPHDLDRSVRWENGETLRLAWVLTPVGWIQSKYVCGRRVVGAATRWQQPRAQPRLPPQRPAPPAHNKPAARAAFLIIARIGTRDRRMKVLLQKRAGRGGTGKLGLVGGLVDRGETSLQAAVRECYEESGIVIDPRTVRYVGKSGEADIFYTEVPAHKWRIPGPQKNAGEVDTRWGYNGHDWCPIWRTRGGRMEIDSKGGVMWWRTKNALQLIAQRLPV